MGYTDQVKGSLTNGNWLDLDGNVAENLPWGVGEPKAAANNYDCARLSDSGLESSTCYERMEHVCMRRKYHHRNI